MLTIYTKKIQYCFPQTGPLQMWYWWHWGDRVWFHLIHFHWAEQSFYWSLSERLQHLHKSISGAEPKHEYEYTEVVPMLRAFKAVHFSSFPLQVNKLLKRKMQKCIMGKWQYQGEIFNKDEDAGGGGCLSHYCIREAFHQYPANISSYLEIISRRNQNILKLMYHPFETHHWVRRENDTGTETPLRTMAGF